MANSSENIAQIIDFNELKAACRSCSLGELCLPRSLDKTDLKRLDNLFEDRKLLHSGEIVFRQGDDSNHIYAVRSGLLKTFTIAKDGTEQVLGFHLPGELVGFDGMDNHSYDCTAIALDTTSICDLQMRELKDLCLKIPSLQNQLLSLISGEFRKDHSMLLLLAKRNSVQKIATFLLDLYSRYKTAGYSGDELRLIMTRAEIANYLGMAVETVSRIFAVLQRKNIICIDGRVIKIINHEELYKITEI